MPDTHCFFWILSLLCLQFHLTSSSIGLPRHKQERFHEVCDQEDFRASCNGGELVIMDRAQYGRMRIGKCVRSDLGYQGCHIDVMENLDDVCSGRQHCEMHRVGRAHFDDVPTCHSEYQRYLEVEYSCVTVLNLQALCNRDEKKVSLPAPSSLIWSPQLQGATCLHSPHSSIITFTVTAAPGQNINISLVDLSVNTSVIDRKCVKYGKVIDHFAQKRSVTICGGKYSRMELLQTKSELVEIQLNMDMEARFGVRFDIQGCADANPPINGWARRDNMQTTVGCHTSDQTWIITCHEGQWHGRVGNCTNLGGSEKALHNTGEVKTKPSMPSDVMLALIIAGGVTVCIAIITGIIVCCRIWTVNTRLKNLPKGQSTCNGILKKHKPGQTMNNRPKSAISQTEDASYDFKFTPPELSSRPVSANVVALVTLPWRKSANMQDVNVPMIAGRNSVHLQDGTGGSATLPSMHGSQSRLNANMNGVQVTAVPVAPSAQNAMLYVK